MARSTWTVSPVEEAGTPSNVSALDLYWGWADVISFLYKVAQALIVSISTGIISVKPRSPDRILTRRAVFATLKPNLVVIFASTTILIVLAITSDGKIYMNSFSG
jgi:hypothetical protein